MLQPIELDGTSSPFYVLAPQEGTWFFEAMGRGSIFGIFHSHSLHYLVILQMIAYLKTLYCALLDT